MIKPSIDRPFANEKPPGWLWLASAGALLIAMLMWPIGRATAWRHRWRNAMPAFGIASAGEGRSTLRPASPSSPVLDPMPPLKNRQQRGEDDPRWREQVFRLNSDAGVADARAQPGRAKAGA